MTREEAIDFGRIWLEMNEDAKDSRTYEFFEVVIKVLEQEPCDELDFVQPHKKIPVNLEICKMREATQKEHEGIENYIDSIAEPCSDAISRQAVLDLVVANHTELNGVNVVMYAPFYKDITQLPPVTPAEKVGHWIDTGSGQECSECGEIQYGYDNFRNYCAYCGTKMQRG